MKQFSYLFNRNYVATVVNESVYTPINLMLSSGIGVPPEWIRMLDEEQKDYLYEEGLLKIIIPNGDRPIHVLLMLKIDEVFNGQREVLKTSLFQAIARWDYRWNRNWIETMPILGRDATEYARETIMHIEPEIIKYQKMVGRKVGKYYRHPRIERLYKHKYSLSDLRMTALLKNMQYGNIPTELVLADMTLFPVNRLAFNRIIERILGE